jgi:protein-tyrosine phosphatase
MSIDQNAINISAALVLTHNGHTLWIGNEASTNDVKFLRDKKIKTNINAHPNISFANHKMVKVRIPMLDPGPFKGMENREVALMFKVLPQAIELIHVGLRHGNVFVNCHAGAQRSAAIILAYLIKYHFYAEGVTGAERRKNKELAYKRAVAHVITRRPRAFYYGASVNFKAAIKRWMEHSL